MEADKRCTARQTLNLRNWTSCIPNLCCYRSETPLGGGLWQPTGVLVRSVTQSLTGRTIGPDGDGVPGADLGHGKFQRASSDDDIESIKTGIAGTRMCPALRATFRRSR